MRSWLRILAVLLTLAISASAAQTGPNPRFRKLDGGSIALNDLRGRVVVISISAKGIPLNRFELPQLERLASKFADKGVAVLWVSANSIRPKSAGYASDEELSAMASQYPHLAVLRDPDREAARILGATSLPTIFVVDKDGRLAGRPYEGVDPASNLVSDLSPLINQLLAQ